LVVGIGRLSFLPGETWILPQIDTAFDHSRHAKDNSTVRSPRATIEANIHNGDRSGILINVVIPSFLWGVWTT
jgi:hypothetical protein